MLPLPNLTPEEVRATLAVWRYEAELLRQDPTLDVGALALAAEAMPNEYRVFSRTIQRREWRAMSDDQVLETLLRMERQPVQGAAA